MLGDVSDAQVRAPEGDSSGQQIVTSTPPAGQKGTGCRDGVAAIQHDPGGRNGNRKRLELKFGQKRNA
jgi:hypothetical protein